MEKKLTLRNVKRQAGIVCRLLLAALLIQGIAEAAAPTANASAPYAAYASTAAHAATKPIQVKRIDGSREWMTEQKLPIQAINGRVYIWIQDLRELFREVSLVQARDGSRVTFAYPGVFAAFRPGSRSAVINGKTLQLDHEALILQRNRMYVSLREAALLLHAGLRYDPAQATVSITYGEHYVVSADSDEPDLFWLDPLTHRLYASKRGAPPILAGTTHAKLEGYGYLESERLDAHNVGVTLKDIYGEPGLGTNVFKFIVHQDKLVLESQASYYGSRNVDSLSRYSGGIVLVDGGSVLLAKPDGTVTQKADIAKMLDSKEAMTVLYAADDALIVQLYDAQMLALVDLKKKTAALLYKRLLPADEQKRVEEQRKYSMDFDYDGDGLDFVRREGDTFYFTHADVIGTGLSNYSLTLQ
ncbi:hypothetical protein GZH47_23145 [Paenibacillus rhizovicinus]|uniref:Copper amine oxidase-like N-terminal domain-containing protein n=1 Tax=Paenibacillus rhizovicinus TaxID=2704463 RepID=A0A6C0P4D6_9BACL|nr:stalk domain-containing protein [Paenibacillus rhizovicinus]QHW33404.1 hypothetical protein GZH47_23145 [Paenibacillus rhizovicinus]